MTELEEYEKMEREMEGGAGITFATTVVGTVLLFWGLGWAVSLLR